MKKGQPKRVQRPYPRYTLEDALKIPVTLKEKNRGDPWSPVDIAKALGIAPKSVKFFYLASASRDYGLTSGGRDSKMVELTAFGRELVFAPNAAKEQELRFQAFLKIEKFKKVFDYYNGATFPEMKYLQNTLQKEFGLALETHDEFSKIFQENCRFLGIEKGGQLASNTPRNGPATATPESGTSIVTLAEPKTETGLKAFVIIPLRERDLKHPPGFFMEVLKSLITPAGRDAGFSIITANRQGSDIIQSTIINDLLDADLVIADLTEHNPNVLFELGLRMAFEKPVALIRAKGTDPIFDVDNMLRVYDYDPNLWQSSVGRDLSQLSEHIRATWEKRKGDLSYMKILKRSPTKKDDAAK